MGSATTWSHRRLTGLTGGQLAAEVGTTSAAIQWRGPGAGVIAGRVLGRVRSGDVVLMHDGGGDRGQTLAALEQVLATLSAKGFRFGALCRD